MVWALLPNVTIFEVTAHNLLLYSFHHLFIHLCYHWTLYPHGRTLGYNFHWWPTYMWIVSRIWWLCYSLSFIGVNACLSWLTHTPMVGTMSFSEKKNACSIFLQYIAFILAEVVRARASLLVYVGRWNLSSSGHPVVRAIRGGDRRRLGFVRTCTRTVL